MAATLKDVAQHLEASRFAEAADGCRGILKSKPKDANALHFLGLAEWQLGGNAHRSVKLIQKAMAQLPNQSHMHHNLASVLGGAGDMTKAEHHYGRAIALKSDYAEAYFNLSGIKKFATGDPAIAAMQALYANPNLSAINRDFICYALSKAHDDIGAYEEAFHFALEGSRQKQVDFDINRFEKNIGELKGTITAERLKPHAGKGNYSAAPIFIVGMPRSGTTLVEQILSRHSKVFAGGELATIGSFHATMRQLAPREWGYKGNDYGFWPLIPRDLINSAAAGYLGFVQKRAGHALHRFTDKMPRNAFHLGLIAMMFPRARIIHVQRHPLDTCVSCFFQRFNSGQEFSYRLDWLGRYYRTYIQTMQHWRDVLPLEMMELRYEDLVADPETKARQLIEFAGLEWQDACLDASAGKSEVKTASRWQVRQPVYSSSVDRWKRYQPYLDPLISALGGMDEIAAYNPQ